MNTLVHTLFALILAVGLVGAAHAQSGSCRVSNSVCIDTGDRVINGVPVSRPCWEYRDTYECVDPGATNYCAGIQAQPNCSLQGVVCESTAFNGACSLETKTYACSSGYTGPPAGVVDLGSTYTILSTNQDLGTCATPASNPACVQTGPQTCVDGPGYKTIDGVSVYQDCWEWSRNYACSVSNAVNYCQPLAGAGCVENTAASTCIETGSDGACNSTRRNYVCTDRPPVAGTNIVQLDTDYTITRDEQDTTACDAASSNPTCAVAETRCIEGPETRVINGLPVYKACWKTQITYSCSQINAANYCAPLMAAGCTRQGTPVCVETGADGQCNRYTETYTCLNNDGVSGTNVVRLDTAYSVRTDAIDESACATQEGSAACGRPPTSVCTQGPETRTINGLAVYKDCWQWERTYSCAVSDLADFCTPLRTLGCTEQSSVCDLTGPDGNCSSFTKTFACLNNTGVTGENVVNLNTSYTVRDDFLDVAPCADAASNPACTLASEVCVEPAETRNINGLAVYKSCWKYERSYTCSVAGGANYCAPVAATPGCTLVDSSCIETGTNGACIASESRYRCDNTLDNPLPPNVTFLNNVYTIVKDEVRDQCTAPGTDPACTLLTEVCAEPGGTRNINGLDVYKPCWRWNRQYICQDQSQAVNECAALESNPACTLARQSCAIDRYTGVPNCGLTTRVFSCQVTPERLTDVQTCFEQSCVGPICGKEPDPADQDFAKSVAVMEMQRQAAGYLDEQGRIFSGIPAKCERRLFGSSNCCNERVESGSSVNNAVFAGRAVYFAAETVSAIGSLYVWDGLYESASNLYSAVSGFLGGTVSKGYSAPTSGTSSISFYGITAEVTIVGNAGTFTEAFSVNWTFNPYSFAFAVAVQVLSRMAACSREEQMLALRKGQRLCTLVGSYTSGRIHRRDYEGYCCYNSRLARIVQEQGRRQLGKSYGSPQNPDCTGLTTEELEQLDFSQIDLSEFIADVQSKAMDTTAALNRFATRGETLTTSTATHKNDAIAQYMPATPGSTGAVDRTPGAPGSPPAQTPRTASELRGCAPPTLIDEQSGACRHPSGHYYEPRSMNLMPCARGFVKDSLVPACVDPATGQYYPLNSTVPMPCPVGRYLEVVSGVCKEPTEQ
jgi:conjugal transfer mating pair stabilization protein TraN